MQRGGSPRRSSFVGAASRAASARLKFCFFLSELLALSQRRTVATIFFCDPQLAHYIAANPPDDDMGDSGSDDEDTSWESKWTEKQEKYKAYAVSKLQKHLAEIQEDIDKYDVKLEKLRKKGAPRSTATAPRLALLTRRLRPPRRAQKRRARRTRRRERK